MASKAITVSFLAINLQVLLLSTITYGTVMLGNDEKAGPPAMEQVDYIPQSPTKNNAISSIALGNRRSVGIEVWNTW